MSLFDPPPRKRKKRAEPAYDSGSAWERVRMLRARALEAEKVEQPPDALQIALEKAQAGLKDTPVAKPKPAKVAKPKREEPLLTEIVAKTKPFAAKLKHFGMKPIVLDHVSPRAQGFAAAMLLAAAPKNSRVWLLCADAKAQDQLNVELGVWQTRTLYFPRLFATVANALPDPDAQAERLSVLSHLNSGMARSILLCADSLDEEVPALRDLDEQQRSLEVGDRLDVEALLVELEGADYERVAQVTERGHFARRGDIVDFFGWHSDEPIRVEVFDEVIESLRFFDVNDQASTRRSERVTFILQLGDDTQAAARVSDHIRAEDLIVEIECSRRREEAHLSSRQRSGDESLLTSAATGSGEPAAREGSRRREEAHLSGRQRSGEESLLTSAATRVADARITFMSAITEGAEDFDTAIHDSPLGMFDASDFVLSDARRKQFDQQLAEWQRDKWKVILFFANEAEQTRFAELASPDGIETRLALLHRGFTIPSAKLAVLTGAELFGRHQVARRIKGSKLDDSPSLRHAKDLVRELREHDLVVHADHGIGKFAGLELRDGKEVLVLRYAEEARLYVPLPQAHLVSRYVGMGGKSPGLSTLGDNRWARTRRNAERSVEEFAAKMLSIAAERGSAIGTSHAPDTKWQSEFEGSFIYRETADQLRCVDEIKRDMEGARPMDRLLCADVGFGKTEVAIRAAFKAVMGGKQCAILAPTTVLVAQHLKTLRERMSEFPVTVQMLCRLTPPDEEREILRGLVDGSVDIVVGTHRLLSKDIRFKDLGLAVVDEEQRFGVKHKERFKEMFRLIDMLTLSATPIPRTLYLALMGMRDMSTIETPPPSRHAVQTTVCPYDDRVIRDAINAELERNGQVFFLHNRVGDIENVRAKLQTLCPKARIVIGHGQMDEGMLEVVMHKFVEGEADVLVCTTIIESGVDVPNANTIIIDRADRFGLADLYQLRGRVGRGDRRAQAYLLLPRDFTDGGDARKRVNAIKQYTALGSGFKIAMRDLEIRGAGNLLGTEQSGHIAAVGFDLYCQMLKQAVSKSQGKRTQRLVDVPMRADFLCLSEAAYVNSLPGMEPAYLPSDYVEDPKLRIQAYRAVAEVSTRKEIDELEAEWKDQFGRLPLAAENLLLCAAIRLSAAQHGVLSVEIKDRKLMLQRHGGFVMVNGKFPRLSDESDGAAQLQETLDLLRKL